ncbi:YggS family pyridoxal phosphate-dependent enzyme [Legionella oakridgensis]|uniref:Pyridoxal phosphate homeostasis protein n=2 Tax=Legionella oakridgensis TaxID=29423 RepID=W0B999_9GAMM|nr:YggS family pyridoxal phosphate-dependent enzyme [Legionella oakridgensis]AHE66425.1 pyridoxal phosphate enzyme, YggS family [Legionella oakridgensis ATCC 33761 = DSM 21215]KTD36864.1 pyridoxal-5'-phosphate dependent enzyme family transporter protein [Legionella oakridgensis]STY19601.1 pyridoxal-5'-phosphate dependent enzyme family [Legionella longbeachae]
MTIAERILHVIHQIHQAEAEYGRPPGTVALIAVSKGQSKEAIEQAFAAGVHQFGENYLQEAEPKINILAKLPITWHFIGPIQSNKCRPIAHYFSWVHSVCRASIAQRLNDARPQSLPALNVCIQINDDDEKKAGIHPEQAAELASAILLLPRLHLRGLMLIPKQGHDELQLYLSFQKLTALLHSLNKQLHIHMDTLSMGMSGDFQVAIRAGSTMVRIGQTIFGERR